MKHISFILFAVMLSGCNTTSTVYNEWYSSNVTPSGFTSYDPPNGDWIFISNEPGLDQLKRTQDWEPGDSKPPRY
jgi:hypothetical protein